MSILDTILAAFLAISESIAAPLINVGIAGIVLWWFMTHTDRRLRSIEERMWRAGHELRKAIELSTRSNLLITLALGAQPLQERAKEMMREVDDISKAADASDELNKPK